MSAAIRRLAGALLLLGAAGAAQAQDLLIRDARIHTATAAGEIRGGDVLVRDGRIAALGTGLAAPAGVQVIAADGRPLTPGLFAGITAIGVEEVSLESATVDDYLRLGAPAWQMQWRPEFDVTLAFNPRSVLLPVARIEGLTWAVVAPDSRSGGAILSGQGAAVTLDGRHDAVLAGSRSLFMRFGGSALDLSAGSRAAQYMLFDQAAREVRSPPAAGAPAMLLPAGREVLARYLDGGRVVFHVHRAADIRQVLALAKRHGIRPVIVGASEAWLLAEELAAARVPVLLDPLENLPASFDQIGARSDAAALLARAGVAVAFALSSDATQNARKIRQLAGNAVAHGLPWELALAALTSTPADIFGVAGSRGRIAVGQVADLVLWSADPLEVTSVAEQVWTAGRPVVMRSRQTELRDRYLERLRGGG